MKKAQPCQRVGSPDDFQSPACALDPLYPYLNPNWTIWEPAAGKGNLVRALWDRDYGWGVVASDILERGTIEFDCGTYKPREELDFLDGDLEDDEYDAVITNPPFSHKDEFLARCYEIGKPFSLLMPLTALEGIERQRLYRSFGVEVIILPRRLNFETPSGNGSGSWFATAWYTWGLNIGSALTFWEGPPGWGLKTKSSASPVSLFDSAAAL